MEYPKEETQLIFKRVGNYSMYQSNMTTDNCKICEQADWGDVLVQPNRNVREFICVKCLLHHYDSTKGLMATDKIDDVLQVFCDGENQPHQFMNDPECAKEQLFYEI
jgi:hypothetical protein